MITHRKSEDRGHANHGWLDARHTFSFAEFHDGEFMGFGPLRVLNQDRIQAGAGFPSHGHRDMEIVTYVLEGSLNHKDSMKSEATILPGEVQLMSAGSGVLHSEFNGSTEDGLHLLQMWVKPAKNGTTPRFEQKDFTDALAGGGLHLVVSPDGLDGSLQIGQEASMYAGRLPDGEKLTHEISGSKMTWLHVASGSIKLNDSPMNSGDGAGIKSEEKLSIEATSAAEIILWEFPTN